MDDTRLIVVVEDEDPLVGKTIRDTLTLRKRIGKGGMGVVYVAWQHSVGREVAVKVMSARLNRDPDAAKRFIREANLASKLSHPNVVTIHDFGQDDDRLLYIVMEYLTGVSLREALQAGETFDTAQVERMVSQLCDALEAAHDASIVHRDLKPANIMLLRKPGARDFLKVLDFGIAKSFDGGHTTITQSNAVLGTPAYMPPEISVSGTFDARSDLYSLGVIVYQLLAGRLPFLADDARAVVAMHATDSVPRLPDRVSKPVADVVYRLLEKEPDRRFQSAAAVRDAFHAAMGGASFEARVSEIPVDEAMSPTIPATPAALDARQLVRAGPTSVERTDRPTPTRGRDKEKSRRWMLAAAVLLAGAAVVAAVLMGGNRTSMGTRERAAAPPAVLDAGGQELHAAPADAAAPAVGAADAGTADAGTTPAPTVRIRVLARGAAVFIDGRLVGRNRADTRLPHGDREYTVRVVRSGYRIWTGRFRADRDRELAPRLVKLATGSVAPGPGQDTPPSTAKDDPRGPWLEPD